MQSQFEVKGDPNSNQEIIPKYARLSRQRKVSHKTINTTLTLYIPACTSDVNSSGAKAALSTVMILNLCGLYLHCLTVKPVSSLLPLLSPFK